MDEGAHDKEWVSRLSKMPGFTVLDFPPLCTLLRFPARIFRDWSCISANPSGHASDACCPTPKPTWAEDQALVRSWRFVLQDVGKMS